MMGGMADPTRSFGSAPRPSPPPPLSLHPVQRSTQFVCAVVGEGGAAVGPTTKRVTASFLFNPPFDFTPSPPPLFPTETNICYNCVDRHVEAGLGDRVAFHW